MIVLIERVQHVSIFAEDLDVASWFYCEVLGMIQAARSASSIYLRAPGEYDAWSLRVREDKDFHHGLDHICLKVSRGQLEKTQQALREFAVKVENIDKSRLDDELEPGIDNEAVIRAVSPDGFPLEFTDNVQQVEVFPQGTPHPKHPRRQKQGMRGLWRIDHVNLRVEDVDRSLLFWKEELGFSVSECVRDESRTWAAWLRRRRISHDVALGWSQAWKEEGKVLPPFGFHHVAYLVETPLDLLYFADRIADYDRPDLIEYGPGRHGISDAYFLYIRDPFGNRIELFCGDYERDLDSHPIVWSPEAYKRRGLLWWGKDPPSSWREILPVSDRWKGSREQGGSEQAGPNFGR
ncbi:MAG: VOC family protein [Candidatus Caldarchaeum sp.]|nr:VOC family protein [Candidatus Caldarchaeum sp.]